jgi:hypothetical protein
MEGGAQQHLQQPTGSVVLRPEASAGMLEQKINTFNQSVQLLLLGSADSGFIPGSGVVGAGQNNTDSKRWPRSRSASPSLSMAASSRWPRIITADTVKAMLAEASQTGAATASTPAAK